MNVNTDNLLNSTSLINIKKLSELLNSITSSVITGKELNELLKLCVLYDL